MDRIRRLVTSKLFLIPMVSLLFYTLAGFVLVPLAVRWYVPWYAQNRLQCRATLEKVRINPFLMSFEAVGFALRGPDGEPIAGFARLFVDFETMGLIHWTTVFREVRLEEPTLNVSINPDGSLNLAALAPKSAQEEPKASSAKSMRLVLQSVTLAGGKATLTDKRQSEPTILVFQDFDLDLKTLSTLHDQSGSYSLAAKTKNGETIEWRGEIGLAPFRSSGKITFKDIQAATLWGFVRNDVNLDSPQGKLDLSLDYRLDASATPLQLLLENLRADLSRLSLKLSNEEDLFFELKKIELNPVRLDLASRTIQAGSLLADGGRLHVRINEAGQANLQQIVRRMPEQKGDQAAPIATGIKVPPSSASSPSWSVECENIEIKDIAFALDDMSRHAPLEAGVSSISVKSSAKIEAGSKTKISLRGFVADLKGVQFGLKEAAKRTFEAKSLYVEGGDLDLDARTINVASVRLGDGRLDFERGRDGRIDLESLFAPGPRAVASGQEGTEVISLPQEAESVPSAPEMTPWKVNVEALEIKDVALGFEDLLPAVPLAAGIGSIGIRLKAKIEAARKTQVAVTGISTELKDIWIGSKGAKLPIFETRRFALEGGELDLSGRTVTVSHVGLNDGRFEIGREADGKMNFERLLAPKPESAKRKAVSAREAPWKFLLKAFELTNFRTAVLDGTALAGKPIYDLQNVHAKLTGVDGKSPMGFEAGFALKQGGKAAVSGKIDPATRSVEAKLSAVGLSLAPLQPYIAPFIKLTLQSAAVSTEGLFRYGLPNAGSKIAYEGSLSLDKLSLNQPGSKETYLGWGAMQVPRMKLTVEPNRVQIGEIKLSKPVGRLIILEDRTFNLAKVVKERGDKSSPPARPAKAAPKTGTKTISAHVKAAQKPSDGSFPFSIGKISIAEGNVVFADLSMRPKFMTRIHGLKGSVGHLSSERNRAAEIRLEGRVDQYGMARIEGSLDLGDFKRFTNITMAFKNVEMASVTPYSGKFAGRKIKSGKLSADLKYRIQDNKLLGENQVIVDNLVLGERVESPDAVNLPLDLAVALLSDSNGRIDIGLPVNGDLNDPQFSLAPLIWKGILNLITKAVTAPFHVLGRLFGGGDEKVDVVEFDPGKAKLLPPEKEKLKKVADALQKRPQLKLVVRGRYSPAVDGLEFKKLAVLRAVAAGAGLKPNGDGGQEPLDLGDSKIRKTLEKLFVARFSASSLDELDRAVKRGDIKPTGLEASAAGKKAQKRGRIARVLQVVKLYKIIPGAKSPEQSQLLAGEMYSRLVESEPVSENVLKELAGNRAQEILAELRNEHGVAADRLAAADPELQAEGEEPSARLSLEAFAGAQ